MIGILDFGPRLRSLELFLSKYRFSLAFTLTVLLSQTPKKTVCSYLTFLDSLRKNEIADNRFIYMFLFS